MEPCSPFKMEQCSPFGWGYFNEEEGMMGELKQYILQTRMEMEATVIAAQEEILRKEEELTHMKELLILTIKERDDAQSKIQKLMLEKLCLNQLFHQQQQLGHKIQQHNHQQQQQQQQQKTVSLSNTNTTPTNCFSASCSESEESSIISSPSGSGRANSPAALQPPPLTLNATCSQLPPQMAALLGGSTRPLPEKGQLLKAVMEAGPLLQTLLLAGPLPQWQHPPPRLNSIEIPPVSINPFTSPGKRGIDSVEGPIISSPKYQRVA